MRNNFIQVSGSVSMVNATIEELRDGFVFVKGEFTVDIKNVIGEKDYPIAKVKCDNSSATVRIRGKISVETNETGASIKFENADVLVVENQMVLLSQK